MTKVALCHIYTSMTDKLILEPPCFCSSHYTSLVSKSFCTLLTKEQRKLQNSRHLRKKTKPLQYQIRQYPHLNHLSTTVKSESPRLQHPPTGWPHCDYDTATLTEAAAILWVDPVGVRRSVQMFGCVGRADSCLQNIPANTTKASYNYWM